MRALTENLGPVQALRFLALVSREPFDYQEWRRQYFSQYDVDELLIELRKDRSRNTPDRRPKVSASGVRSFQRFENSRNVEVSAGDEHESSVSPSP